MLGEEYKDYEKSFEEGAYKGLRVNTLKISVEDFLKISPFELKKIPWTENGFYYNSDLQPAKHPYYFAGLYYLQEPSAMAPASFLPIEEGDKVLDICAAPGGKTTELAAKLNHTGMLVSNDISHSRAKALLKNVELFGATNTVVLSEPPVTLAKRFPKFFDKILIDAPCSGEGMFRKDPAIIKNWEQNGEEPYKKLQYEILEEAQKMLKPGGMILYSTCTFATLENETSISDFLNNHKEYDIVKLPLYDGFDTGHPEWIDSEYESLRNARRIWPHKIKGEGHFVCLLKNQLEEESSCLLDIKGNKTIPTELQEFMDLSKEFYQNKKLLCFQDKWYLVPEQWIDTKGLRMLRSGLYLGEMKKNRFEPSQSLACALKQQDFSRAISLEASDERVVRYLKGETIEVEGENGLTLVCVDGFGLGWGKVISGSLKNKYLPGWRWM